MYYCYATMKNAAINNPNHIKIDIDEFLTRLDLWFIVTDSSDELEEIILGLMDGLSDEQIKFYTQKCFTKKQMMTLRIMISNGVNIHEINKIARGFKGETSLSKHRFAEGEAHIDTINYLDQLKKSHQPINVSPSNMNSSNIEFISKFGFVDDEGKFIQNHLFEL